TTEPNKLPATILSRCQRHDFRRIPPEVIADRLNYVCSEENIPIEKEAADLIARLSDGALRDALSILEVCAANLENGAVSFDYASKVLGYLDTEKMIWMCVCIKNGDAEGALRGFWELYDNSFDCGNFCASLLDMFRNIQVAKLVSEPLAHIRLEKGGAEKIIALSKDFDGKELLRSTQLVGDTLISLGRYTQNKRVAIELMIVELCQRQAVADLPKQVDQPAVLPAARPVAGGGGRRYFDKYADLIEEISKENKMIVPYLKSGKCIIDESEKRLFIYVDNDFKANVLKEEKNLAVIQNNLSKFYAGLSVAIEAQKEKKADEPAQNSIDDILGNI
ncbi:MAG: hypothetical protein FWH48_00325, partial [Oscillospiraceae bacterium]|nr:hypothetical protein [Oscillospiraceae bacterium]